MFDAVTDLPTPERGFGADEVVARALLMRAETGLLALDRDSAVVLANPAAQEMLGLAAEVERSPLPALLRQGKAFSAAAAAELEGWLDGGAAEPFYLPLDTDAKLSFIPSAGPDGHTLLAVKRVARAGAPSARRDPLTGLSDRVWFTERLTAALVAAGSKPALLLLDLDRFKAVNDSLGHPIGDALLKLVAKRLTGALRDADVISRLSGDEFAVVIKRPRDPEAVGRRLVVLLSRPYLIEGVTVSIGASVGIALGPEHGSDALTLISAADVALYAAKNGGRGNARLFDAELEATTRARHHMAEALRKAVPLRQFDLHFQPQMVLETGALSGFEAFLRWEHPELGPVLPPTFLPIAEATGLIWPIGEWVLHRACEEARHWPEHLTVSINISGRQLMERNRLPRMIKSVLARTGLPPNRLEIEVPEAALTAHPETTVILSTIVSMGVRVSLDDFGTGYSSLNHLRQFPLHKLKIDHSFIQALGESDEASNVVRAVAALGSSLGVVTIAEGVETLEQQRRVHNDGCIAIQGYLLSRPVPASEVAGVIASLSPSASRSAPVA